MAKSTRSKVKRSYRRSKREAVTSTYHAIEAARLGRLSAKLRAKFDDEPTTIDDKSAEVVMEDDEEEDSPAGWLEFALFGLLDPDDIGFARPPKRKANTVGSMRYS